MLKTVPIAWQGVRSRPGRSLLTALSLFVGVLAIVVIQAGAGAARDAMLSTSILTGGRAVTLAVDIDAHRAGFERAEHFAGQLKTALQPVGGQAAVVVETHTLVNGSSVPLTLSDGDLRGIRPFPVLQGSWLGPTRGLALPLVLNEQAAKEIEAGVDTAVSLRLPIAGERTTAVVLGVVEDGQREPHAYAPLDLTRPWVRALSFVQPSRVLVQASGVDAERLRAVAEAEYGRSFDTRTAASISRLDQEEALAQQLKTVGLIFSGIAGLSLVVGALGILNIGLATLRERSDELSLRRSFGATRTQVVAVVVLEGQMVAGVAAVLALGIGLATFPWIASAMSAGVAVTHQDFPLASAVVGVAASCSAALLGSLAPAVRAGRVPIASIMRT